MSFQPVLPLEGYVGWRFLQRTLESQQSAHAGTAAAQRDEGYFRDRIAAVNTAEELVADRRLLRITLTAFGLEDDLPNRAFVQKALESSIYDTGSFVNRLTDKRYFQLAEAFGFGDRAVPRNKFVGFANTMLEKYRDRSFEVAVGAQNDQMRQTLAAQRDLPELAAKDASEATRWYTVLGTPSLRAMFEQAFNLPSSFGTIDVDRQVEVLKERTARLTGSDSVAQFAEPEALEALTRRFFLVGQISQIQASSSQANALGLLQMGQASLAGFLNR